MSVTSIIDRILDVEGEKYTNDPKDSGGETKWGWTKKALREMGWFGNVRDLDRATAYDLYYRRFVVKSGFEPVLHLSECIAEELIDTSVNMGEGHAGRFLQLCLNAFNNEQSYYPDIVVDGKVGPATIKSLRAFLKYRGAEGEVVMMRGLNALQGARYLELAEAAKKNERFVYGWLLNRVVI